MKAIFTMKAFLLGLLTMLAYAQEEITQPPLATWDPSQVEAFNDATVGEGTLELSEGCSYLLLETKTVLLVWPAPTSWQVDEGLISFVDVLGETLDLHHGDRVVPGGAAATVNTPYLQAPDPSCEADETFVVATLRRLTAK